ncbi:RagB/SusD family nutrient uptake outer membrane protein [Parafilimonas sp.]|uniref:RagB/SusD family nutrient uptake outer membrane protein n=1 Tax=Parafilimonas sp. TaxID=1969739 RepID=UPI0039E5EFD1
MKHIKDFIGNRTIGIGILVTMLTCGLISCKKYLDKKYSNTITTPTSLTDLQALLDDASGTMNVKRTPSFGEASADDYFCLPEQYANLSSWQQQAYIWMPYDYTYPNDWSICYVPVYNANYCLDAIGDIGRNSENAEAWDNVKGSALFFRSYYFLMLDWTFSKAYDESSADTDKGIVLRLTSNYNEPSVRSSVRESYNQVITDTKVAADLLPDLPLHSYRPSKCAAYGLLSRAYLSMRIYDSAYKYANMALLLKNDLMDLNGDEDIGTLTDYYPFKKFNKETVFYTEMNASGTFSLIVTPRGRVDSSLINTYDSSDLRKIACFAQSGNYYLYKGSYAQSSLCFTGLTTAEMLLMRAECAIRTGDAETALSDLNRLLENRYKTGTYSPLSMASGDSILDRILLERRKELLFRGLRWMDIKRLNKEGRDITLKRIIDGKVYTLAPDASYYALPLPKDIIDITGIAQN